MAKIHLERGGGLLVLRRHQHGCRGVVVDLRELRTFVAVVEEGRFAGAAQRLNLSQPAISHTIRGLEKHCGVLLLKRPSSGVVTTAAGQLLVAEARAVPARYEQAVAAMARATAARVIPSIQLRVSEQCAAA
jgi:DNA-binding transcriptional LysR family regulator